MADRSRGGAARLVRLDGDEFRLDVQSTTSAHADAETLPDHCETAKLLARLIEIDDACFPRDAGGLASARAWASSRRLRRATRLAAAYEDARSEATDAHLDGDALACVASLRAMGVETVGALTNGNAHACGRLGAVLDYWLTAGDVGAAKPRAPPFLAACAQSRSVWKSTMTRPCWLNRSARDHAATI